MSRPRLFPELDDARKAIAAGIAGGYPVNPFEVRASDIVEICESHWELEVLLNKIITYWDLHQQTKFKSDGSHFQADVNLNRVIAEARKFQESLNV